MRSQKRACLGLMSKVNILVLKSYKSVGNLSHFPVNLFESANKVILFLKGGSSIFPHKPGIYNRTAEEPRPAMKTSPLNNIEPGNFLIYTTKQDRPHS